MLNAIVKLANIYDKLGDNLKADALDSFLTKYISAGKEPSPKDLFQEESWIAEDVEDPTKDLFGDDLMTAKLYLDGHNPNDIPELLQQLKSQQQDILSALSKLLPGNKTIDALPKQLPITPEASLLNDFQKLADLLDQNKLFKQADNVDKILAKFAQGLPPDDDDFEEPTTQELKKMENEPDEFLYQALDLLQLIVDGKFNSLQDVQDEVADLLKSYDSSFNVQDNFESDFADIEVLDDLPDNVIPFKEV